jgi:hypothetical protein
VRPRLAVDEPHAAERDQPIALERGEPDPVVDGNVSAPFVEVRLRQKFSSHLY